MTHAASDGPDRRDCRDRPEHRGRQSHREQRHGPGAAVDAGGGEGGAARRRTRQRPRHAGRFASATPPAARRAAHRAAHRALRREAPRIVAVLADEAHFARMRTYRTFAFDDHHRYLRRTEGLLRTLAAEDQPVRIALFDAVGYERFCADQGLDPDAPDSRVRYTAEAATAGPTLPYRGEDIDHLVPRLLGAHTSRLTWEAASETLARAGACPRCGTDIARAAFDRAARSLAHVLEASGPGVHHLVCSAGTADAPLVAAADAHKTADGALHADESALLALTAALATSLATGSPGGLVCRTDGPQGARDVPDPPGTRATHATPDAEPVGDVVRGWTVVPREGRLRPLTAAEVFAAYCTDPATGDPEPPEHGVTYAPGHQLPAEGGPLHCQDG